MMMMSCFSNLHDKNDEIMQGAVAKCGAIDKREKAIQGNRPLTKTQYAG
jgi:hypothetical protein